MPPAPKSAENKLCQNGQNAHEDDVRATDQKPILTAAGNRARYHVPLGDNVDRDGLKDLTKEGWNHDLWGRRPSVLNRALSSELGRGGRRQLKNQRC